MSIEIFNRVETKFIVTEKTYKAMLNDIKEHMVFDEHSRGGSFYKICNIYFDTEDDNLIRTSLEKPKYKEKFRLRAYGIPDLNSKVFLEIKKKFKGVVNKRRTEMTLKEGYSFASSHRQPVIMDYMNKQVIKELQYSFDIYDLVPKVFISYERVALFGKEDSSFRITFDKNIIGRREDIRLEYGVFGERVVNRDVMVMEVKYSDRMPLWFIKILRKYNLNKTSFSKYGTEYTNYIEKKINPKEEIKYA